MNPLSPNHFFDSPKAERFFQNEEDSQETTIQKSSQVALVVFSFPSQSIEDRTLSHSWDIPDSPLSASDIPLEDVSYYAQGSFSLDDLSDDEPIGYKRLGSPIEEPLLKRICLSKPKGCQNPNPISNERQISSVLGPFEGEPQSIPQLDNFSQMVNTWEVSAPSRGERWVGESSQSPLDSDEEFIQFTQKETAQIDENEKEADEEKLSLSEAVGTDSDMERPQIEGIEKFDEKKISLKDRFILNALYNSHGLLRPRALAEKLNKKNVIVTEGQVNATFRKYDLSRRKKRIAAAQAGWPRFKALPFLIEPGSEKSLPLPSKQSKINDPIIHGTVARFACENLELNCGQIADQLKKQDIFISATLVHRILVTKGLSTFENRREAAKTLQIQDLNEEIERRSTFSELPESVEQQAESSKQPQIQKQQKDDVFYEETIDDDSRIVLNAMYEDARLGYLKLYYKLLDRNITHISSKNIEYILKKFDLSNRKKREAARDAGWPRFKTLPLPMEPQSKR